MKSLLVWWAVTLGTCLCVMIAQHRVIARSRVVALEQAEAIQRLTDANGRLKASSEELVNHSAESRRLMKDAQAQMNAAHQIILELLQALGVRASVDGKVRL